MWANWNAPQYWKLDVFEEYLRHNILLPPAPQITEPPSDSQPADPKQSEFLSDKDRMKSMIDAAQSPEEVRQILLQFTPKPEECSSSKDCDEEAPEEPDFSVFGNSGF